MFGTVITLTDTRGGRSGMVGGERGGRVKELSVSFYLSINPSVFVRLQTPLSLSLGYVESCTHDTLLG